MNVTVISFWIKLVYILNPNVYTCTHVSIIYEQRVILSFVQSGLSSTIEERAEGNKFQF